MEVKEFRFLTTEDNCDTNYEAWSRIYEYPYVLNVLEKLGANKDSSIHNSSWGFEGCHVMFKDKLDAKYPCSLHSDIRPSTLPNTMYYDITKPISARFKGSFDFVLNISTVEEVPFNNIEIIKNLFEQVKINGYLILTFDVSDGNYRDDGCGSMNVAMVEDFVKSKIGSSHIEKHIRGSNSRLPNARWSFLRCGVLVIQKTAD